MSFHESSLCQWLALSTPFFFLILRCLNRSENNFLFCAEAINYDSRVVVLLGLACDKVMATCEGDGCCTLAGKKNYMTLDQVIWGFATFLIFQKWSQNPTAATYLQKDDGEYFGSKP